MSDPTNPYNTSGAQGPLQPQQFPAPDAAQAQQFPAPGAQAQQFPGAQPQQFPAPANQLPAVAPGQAAPAAPTGGFSTGGLGALGLALVPWILFTLWWTADPGSGLESALSGFVGKFSIVLGIAAAAYGFSAMSKDRKEGKAAWWLGIIGAIAGILYAVLFVYLLVTGMVTIGSRY